jgi:hypothetical protein
MMTMPKQISVDVLFQSMLIEDIDGELYQGIILKAMIPYVVVWSAVCKSVLLQRWGVVAEVDGLHFLHGRTHFEYGL